MIAHFPLKLPNFFNTLICTWHIQKKTIMCSVSQTYLTTGFYVKERLLKNTFSESLQTVGVFLTQPLEQSDVISSKEYRW